MTHEEKTQKEMKEIKKRDKKCKGAVITTETMRKIEKTTVSSYARMDTTLSKYPTSSKRIKGQLATNKEEEAQKQRESESEAKAEVAEKTENEAMAKVTKQTEVVEFKKDSHILDFVIDASITGIDNLREILSMHFHTKSKFILTSMTIKELDIMQNIKDIDGNDARYILALAAENPAYFQTVLIDETLDTPDNCIIKYCADNKERVALLTSDKTMALNARMYSVQVHYLKQTKPRSNSKAMLQANSKVATLIPAHRFGNKLQISKFQTETLSIRVYSNGIEYNDGIRELNIGDDVFVAKKKSNFITFAHYRMIALSPENNCEIIYSKRLYDYNIDVLPKEAYKSFMTDFKHRHNL